VVRLTKIIVASLAVLTGLPAAAVWYTNETEFLEALIDVYNEPLNMHTPGNPLSGASSWAAPGADGFGWTLLQDLTSIEGGVVQDVANEELAVFITGRATYAFGGYFFGLDGAGNLHTNTRIYFHGGPGSQFNYEYSNGHPGLFLGWVGNVELESFFVHVATNNPSIPAYAAVTGILVGSIVPEPSPAVSLAIGVCLLAVLHRRGRAYHNLRKPYATLRTTRSDSSQAPHRLP